MTRGASLSHRPRALGGSPWFGHCARAEIAGRPAVVCGVRGFCGLMTADETGVLHWQAAVRLRETLRTRSG
ncbi:hypothetical protein PSAC2689_160090 [Paraburkholderia sacchari]